jgi:aryl-alcohol dehydrogenase-like predicted oxidoreductase
VLGRSGIEVSEIGFGCSAIGGPFTDSTSGGIPIRRPSIHGIRSGDRLTGGDASE